MKNHLKIILLFVSILMGYGGLSAQGIRVSGIITDERNEPLPGVTITVKNTTIGMPSASDGTYQITVPSAESVLQFSYIGLAPVEIVVGKQRIINVTMYENAQIEEVVVIAYGTQKKPSVTSAISSVQTDELLKSPTTSLGNALAGRLPGIATIQYSGLPGYDDPTIYLRGVATLDESNSRPLILVDGVERPFTQLDPNEVADISILKDAGSTAVFGVRGANGVILVTTKRGETGKARVTASASYGLQQPMKIVEFAGSYLYATTYNNAQLSDGLDPTLLMFKQEALDHYKLGDQPVLYPSIDWMSYILKQYAAQDQVNVNVSGGNDRAKYFVSVSRLFQDGLFKTFSADSRENFKYTRYNYRANLDINLTKSTLLSISLGGRIEDRNTPNDDGGESAREGNIFRYLTEAPPMSGAGIIDGKHITYNKQLTPMYIIRDGFSTYYGRGYRSEVTNVVNFDLALTQKLDMITPGLDVKFKGSYNNNFVLTKSRPSNSYGERFPTYYPNPVYDSDNKLTGYTLEKMTDSQVLSYSESQSYGRDWYFDVSFNYNHRFAEKHNVTALLLYNQSKIYYPSSYTDIPRGYIGLVARVTYDFQMKYLLDLNMGYNGSENFAPGKRYGFFPSISAGWNIAEENFMKGQSIFNYLKVRYSYGLVGNDSGVGRFIYTPASYSFGPPSFVPASGNYGDLSNGYLFGDYTNKNGYKPNVRENNLGNPNVSWEKARKQNIGLDFKVAKSRFEANFDYFWEHRWDILISNPTATIPAHFALPNAPAINYGIVDNHGFEITLSWSDKIGSDFKYTIAPNMSFSRNKRIEMLEVPPSESYLKQTGTKVGQPFGYEFFGYYYPGIEKEYVAYMKSRPEYKTYWVANHPNEEYTFPKHFGELKPGDCVYLDLNYDEEINANDRDAIGLPQYPEYFFGLNMNFKYKRFELSLLWIGATNTDRNLGGYQMPFGSQNNGALIRYVAENSWTDSNPNSVFPRITFTNRENNSQFSRIYLMDASYARLKNLEFSYDLDVKKVPYINNLRLFFTAYNLLTFTKYKANDPETTGGEYGAFFRYPPTRIYNMGFRLGF